MKKAKDIVVEAQAAALKARPENQCDAFREILNHLIMIEQEKLRQERYAK